MAFDIITHLQYKQMTFNAIIFKTCFLNVHCDSDNNKLSLYSNNWFFHCIKASADNYLLQYMCLFSPPLVGGCELSMIPCDLHFIQLLLIRGLIDNSVKDHFTSVWQK